MTIMIIRRRSPLASLSLALVFPLILLVPNSASPARAASPDAAGHGATLERYVAFAGALPLWVDLIQHATRGVLTPDARSALDPAPGPAPNSLVPDLLAGIRDVGGDTDGNGDWIAQCGETIEFLTAIDNIGSAPATRVVGTISTDDPYLDVLYNERSTFRDIAPGDDALGDDDWDIAIGAVPDGHRARFDLVIDYDRARTRRSTEHITIECDRPPPIFVSGRTVDDGVFGDSAGNADRRAQCGELIELYVELENVSGVDLDAYEATLSTEDPFVSLLYNTVSDYPPLRAGASGENRDDWDIQIGEGFPDRHQAVFTLTIDQLDLTLDVPVTLRCDG